MRWQCSYEVPACNKINKLRLKLQENRINLQNEVDPMHAIKVYGGEKMYSSKNY